MSYGWIKTAWLFDVALLETTPVPRATISSKLNFLWQVSLKKITITIKKNLESEKVTVGYLSGKEHSKLYFIVIWNETGFQVKESRSWCRKGAKWFLDSMSLISKTSYEKYSNQCCQLIFSLSNYRDRKNKIKKNPLNWQKKKKKKLIFCVKFTNNRL